MYKSDLEIYLCSWIRLNWFFHESELVWLNKPVNDLNLSLFLSQLSYDFRSHKKHHKSGLYILCDVFYIFWSHTIGLCKKTLFLGILLQWAGNLRIRLLNQWVELVNRISVWIFLLNLIHAVHKYDLNDSFIDWTNLFIDQMIISQIKLIHSWIWSHLT